jgi:hypothetical protein
VNQGSRLNPEVERKDTTTLKVLFVFKKFVLPVYDCTSPNRIKNFNPEGHKIGHFRKTVSFTSYSLIELDRSVWCGLCVVERVDTKMHVSIFAKMRK